MNYRSALSTLAIFALAITASASPGTLPSLSKRIDILPGPDYRPLKMKCEDGPPHTFVAIEYGNQGPIETFQYGDCIHAEVNGKPGHLVYFCQDARCIVHKDKACMEIKFEEEYTITVGTEADNFGDLGQLAMGSSIQCNNPYLA